MLVSRVKCCGFNVELSLVPGIKVSLLRNSLTDGVRKNTTTNPLILTTTLPTMPIALHKVTKKIKAKKGGKLDSLGRRDSKKLNRATLRDQKLKKLGTSRSKLKEIERKSSGFPELTPNES